MRRHHRGDSTTRTRLAAVIALCLALLPVGYHALRPILIAHVRRPSPVFDAARKSRQNDPCTRRHARRAVGSSHTGHKRVTSWRFEYG